MSNLDLSGRHPSTQHIMGYFTYSHLPEYLQGPSHACADLAEMMVERLPDGPELTYGLRQLLLAKDAFVRTALDAAKAAGLTEAKEYDS